MSTDKTDAEWLREIADTAGRWTFGDRHKQRFRAIAARLEAPAALEPVAQAPFAKWAEKLPQFWPEAFKAQWHGMQSNAPALQTTSQAAAFWFDTGYRSAPNHEPAQDAAIALLREAREELFTLDANWRTDAGLLELVARIDALLADKEPR